MSATVLHGDCRDVLPTLPDNSIDAVVTDPPYELDFMGKHWDRSGVAFDVTVWAEVLRVLKPGGHVLAFGGTRTFHRLAVAVEDAGFEIRDSIAWMYGSGFPKSLDVSKAIDRAGGDTGQRVFRSELRAAIVASGLTFSDIDRALGVKSTSCYWVRDDHRACLPAPHHWRALGELLPLSSDLDALYVECERADREVSGPGGNAVYSPSVRVINPGTPASPAAVTWQGWGTAMKPAWESVVCAQKPLQLWDRIGSRLDDLERTCRQSANDAARSSTPTPHGSHEVRTATVPESAATPHEVAPGPITATGTAAGSSVQTDMLPSESEMATCSNIVTSWKRCWDALSEPMSMSTTPTAIAQTTDPTTLWSCLSRLMGPSTLLDPTSHDGLSSLARVVDNLFGAAVLNLNATRALTVTEPATSPTRGSSREGDVKLWLEPVVVARKPLVGTVAANVLAWGTGALNVDACRVKGPPSVGGKRRGSYLGIMNDDGWTPKPGEIDRELPAGRWPPNVALDEYMAAELDAQSGDRPGFSGGGATPGEVQNEVYGDGWRRNPEPALYGDTGGASRFMYVAKAPASERPNVNGIAHATVKPLTLIRWLCRLITPPAGTILDLFGGSGTTAEAAILEGFNVTIIEKFPDYLPLIHARIERAYATPLQDNLLDGLGA